MSYEMTHLILMLKGPDAAEFVVKPEEDADEGLELRNYGNYVTHL